MEAADERRLTRPQRNRLVVLWASYDFARSISLAAFALYFSQWLVIDHDVPDLAYNVIFVAASLALLLTAPRASLAADRLHLKMPYLRLLTAAELLSLVAVGVLASYCDVTLLVLALAAICFALNNYFHQFASIFYNALLPSIAREGTEGRISGVGLFAKLMGTVAGLAFAAPFGRASFAWLGHPGRSQVFLPATIASAILVVPSLFLREPPRSRDAAPAAEPEAFFQALARLCRSPGVGAFLLGYFLFNDAILTVQDNLPIYMQRVVGLPDQTKSIILGATLVAGAMGGLFGGGAADRIGLKRSLMAILIAWLVLLPALALAGAGTFMAIVVVLGFLFGLTVTVTRATMAHLAPADRPAYAFSYYTIAERFSTFFGPLAWGGVTSALAGAGAVRYRVALLTMALFVAAGLAAVRRVPDINPTLS